MNVRRTAAGDEEMLRALRLQALSDAPEAFGSTYEREVARTTSDWRRWFAHDSATFVAEHPSGSAVGLVAGRRDLEDPAVVHLMSMWVHPTSRRTGAADALVAEVLSWAKSEGADVVRLLVVKNNDAARRLYERHSFQPTGHETVRECDGIVEVEMERRLHLGTSTII
jgi:ribosomal protein S18 acetylase RimI-like enzyme